MILTAGSRCDGDQFRKDREDRDSTDPDNEVAVDDTCGAAILEADEK